MVTGLDRAQRRRILRVMAAVLFGIGLVLLSGARAWSISPAGPATVTGPDGMTPLTSGGSATPFDLVPPTNAHCTKDTSTGHYTFTTYIVSASTDPATLTWAAGAPNQGFQLLDAAGGTAVGPTNTAIGSGNIQPTPTLNLALFTATGTAGTNMLPVGAYNVGIACTTNTNMTDVFWNAVFTFTASSSDPNGEVWTAAPTSAGPTTTSTSTSTSTSTTVADATTSSTTGSNQTATTSGSATTASTLDSSGTTSPGGLVATGARAKLMLAVGIGVIGAGFLVVAASERRRHDGPR